MNTLTELLASESVKAAMPVAAVVVSVFAFLVSATTLALSIRNRRLDIARQKANDRRIRVWGILCADAGSRSVEALDQPDNKTESRLKFLQRTATQLEQADALDLATKLRVVIEKKSWPTLDPEATRVRKEFFDAVTNFMK